MKDPHKTPYHQLGSRLKSVRIDLKESLAETSGAVEIEQEELQNYERGRKCPSEDVLLLLISHFEIAEEEAARLWELAGYDGRGNDDMSGKQTVTFMPVDNRIVYSDHMQVTINKYGAILNFMQNMGEGNQVPVARVGMSKEHAQRIIEVLQATLTQSEKNSAQQKSLTEPKSESSDKS